MNINEIRSLAILLILVIFTIGALKINDIKNDKTKAIVATCTKIVLASFLALTIIILLLHLN